MSDKAEIPNISPECMKKAKVDENAPPPVHSEKSNGKRNRITGYVILAFCVIGLIALGLWWFVFRNHESTDDAYVGGNMVVLTARQKGSVLAYYADDTDYVEEGQILVTLDPTDYMIAFEQRKAALEIAARQVREQYEAVRQREADVAMKRAIYVKTSIDFKNRMALVNSEAISKEDYDHAKADFRAARASLRVSKHELIAAVAALGDQEIQKHPQIEKAKADMREAYLGLSRCSILAPIAGYVAKRSVQAGHSIDAATPLMSIIPLDAVWVDANYKETQLSHMRIGQPVDVIADMYGGHVVYHGTVGGLQPGSGSVFSLLPPQNATGNWIKIVQRVPVRIYLDPKEVKRHPLLLGLSVTTKVYVEDRNGERLSGPFEPKPLMQTTVFDVPLDAFNSVLDQIVDTNLGLIPSVEIP